MKRSLSAPYVALALLLVLGTSVQAGTMATGPVLWEYNFTPVNPTPAPTGGGSALYADNATNKNGGITFNNDITREAEGSSKNIVATNLKAFGSAGTTFDYSNGGAWKMSMLLSHTGASGKPESKTLYFGGKISGSFSNTHSDLVNDMVGFANAAGAITNMTTMKVTLGAYDFTVTLLPVIMPGPANQNIQGAIAAKVEIAPTGSGETAGTPEPSTMLLAGFGMTFLGASAWRRKRRACAA